MPRLAALADLFTLTARLALAAGLAAPVLVAGCSDTCDTAADCPAGSVCDDGLCLDGSAGGTGGTGNAGGGGGPDGGSGGGGGTACADRDEDGSCDADDLCPDLANPGQEDGDADRLGDACDPCPADAANDADHDGVCGDVDLCPETADPDQADLDADGRGDACDDDDDGDGAPDGTDCAPRDPAIHPGAVDPCDWVDQDCVPRTCEFPVTALGAAQRMVDVSCLPDTRRCAVVTSTPAGAGSLLFVELGSPPSLLFTQEVSAPRGVMADVVQDVPSAWVTSATSVRGIRLGGTGETLTTLATGGGVLLGPVASVQNGYLAAAAMEDSRLLLFSPDSLLFGGVVSRECAPETTICRPVAFDALAGASGPLGTRRPHRVELRKPTLASASLAYVTFADDDRLVVLTVAAGQNVQWDSSALLEPELGPPVELSFDPAGDRVYLLADGGAGAWVTPDYLGTDHRLDGFTTAGPLAPTALAVLGRSLVVADVGDAAGPRLVSLDLDLDGKPVAGEAHVDALPDCVPMRMVPLPGIDGSLPPVLAIACEDADSLLIFGRD